jgi:uncharacterized membrane protein
MRIRLESVKRIGKRIGLTGEKGYLLAIFLALVLVSVVIGGYYIVFRPQPEPYNTIYLLDSQKQADNYPQVLVANENSTFSIYVNVENHMGGIQNQTYQIQVKITQNISSFPVPTHPIYVYDLSLADGDTWSKLATVTENNVGSYWVVFELYQNNNGDLVFTQDYCVLNIEVIS